MRRGVKVIGGLVGWVGGTVAALAAAVANLEPGVLGELRAQAAAVVDRFQVPDVRAFIRAAESLPDPGTRVVWRSKDRAKAFSDAEYQQLPEAHKADLTKRECDASFYYQTGYGTPIIYARPLELAARAGDGTIRGKKVLDFGYGMIGQLRMLASLGCDVQGIEVEPLLRALYSQPMDTGEIACGDGTKGRLTLHHARWPGEKADVVGGGHDLFITKNVLKRGYIHPERPADERFLIKLGVPDDQFVRALHDTLKPGGIAIIYNISPAQNPDDKPFLPHADPRCPFPRADLEKAGFEVVEYDADDSAFMRQMWPTLGLTKPGEEADLDKSLFARYTLLRRTR
ncbi:MAG: hypothetical protein ACKVW3_04345 [Phycisphaerales bacterium]